ncbi:MAG: doubled motif LPXTG anchor domain-containing protein [Lacrimispora sp.]|uniref:doubled motif LPXTG anchor domain-containing protein n=1 Tax=Lacrimispora sp. TaxID=2719234 RepID=UPI0039E3519C
MRRKKLLSKVLAVTLAISMVPANAFAETGTPPATESQTEVESEAPAETEASAAAAPQALAAPQTSNPADQLKSLAQEAETAAANAERAAKAVEDAKESAESGLIKVNEANDAAKAALEAAKAEDAKAANGAGTVGSVVNQAKEELKEAKTVKQQQDAIDKAVEGVEAVITEANTAVEKAEEVVKEAEEVKTAAKEAAVKAEEALTQAQTALEKAEEAEKIYHELLTAAVENDPKKYKELAQAENAMNKAWNEYANQKNKADTLTIEAQDMALAAEQKADEAMGAVKDAYEKAEAAQAEADLLYAVWQEAEAAMKAALENTNDAELKELEASRAKARDAALSAKDKAIEARQNAIDTYVSAQEAIAIANEAVDQVNNTDWSIDEMVSDLEVLAKETQLVDTSDLTALKKRQPKNIYGKVTPYTHNINKFSPGSQNNNYTNVGSGKGNYVKKDGGGYMEVAPGTGDYILTPMDERISGYETSENGQKDGHSFLRLWNEQNHKNVGYSVNMPAGSDLDYVLFKTTDDKWFVWSNKKNTKVENFENVFLNHTANYSSYFKPENNAPEYNFTGTGKENSITVTTPYKVGSYKGQTVWGEIKVTYWIEKTERGYEIHMENHSIQKASEANKQNPTPGYQNDCVVGEAGLKQLSWIYGDPAAPLTPPELEAGIDKATGAESVGMELSTVGGYSSRTDIKIPEIPKEPVDPEQPTNPTNPTDPKQPNETIPDNDVPGGNGGSNDGGSSNSSGPGAGTTPVVTIEDNQTPLAALPGGGVQGISIIVPDNQVPLAGLPKTGDSTSSIPGFMAFMSGFMSLTAGLFLLLNERKRTK